MASRIGVTICDCKGQISDHLDTAAVAEEAAALDDVGFVDRVELLCNDEGISRAVERLQSEQCDRLLFVGCSPRSSLKFPEERIADAMDRAGLRKDLFEVANIREQCAWQHDDRKAATQKAVDLVAMAHARLVDDEPAPKAVPIARRALVVGGGTAGLQTAKDLASANIDVTVAERGTWFGGRLCQLHRVFQSEAWPSVCESACVGPVQAKGVMVGRGIRALSQTEVTDVQRQNGNFRVSLKSAPAHVDADLCISCGKCAEVCPEVSLRPYDKGERKAIDKEFERALPDVFTIVADACTRCGDCVDACPTDAIDLDAQATTTTDDFGAVFLATGFDPIDLSNYPQYQQKHLNVVTSLELELMMDAGVLRPSDGEEPETVVFVQCAGSRAPRGKQGVSYCSKTCCSVTAKQVDRLLASNPMVEPIVVYYRDMRTYERAMEELNQKLHNLGIEFVNGEVTGIEANDDDGLVIGIDPYVGEDEEADPITLDADLVVLATAQTPSRGSAELFSKFGIEVDRYGYPVENQPRLFRPTESLVDRVHVVGASSGPKVIQQASEQGSAAAMRALPALLDGAVEPNRYASRVNPTRCIKCRSCETICPHGAIVMTEEGAVSDPAFCQACGFCAAACPVHAAELTSFTDRQILAQAKVAFSAHNGPEPRILALLCYWCSYSAADFLGIKRNSSPVNYRTIRVRCSSSVNTSLLMQMFRLGIDGIVVAGCPEKSCHHLYGNFVADKRIDLARAVMGQLGLDPARLRFEYIGAPMHEKLKEVLETMSAKLAKLGRNPVAQWYERGIQQEHDNL